MTCTVCLAQLMVKAGASHLSCPHCKFEFMTLPVSLVNAEYAGLTDQDKWEIERRPSLKTQDIPEQH